jgi:hypothetical protein
MQKDKSREQQYSLKQVSSCMVRKSVKLAITKLTIKLNKEELPIRLAHRVKELDELPSGLADMPSIIKVKNWYAQSFEVRLSILK